MGAARGVFFTKREDLSSEVYGGNKVRTLQHTLAVCEARIANAKTPSERAKATNLVVVGTGGSNQVRSYTCLKSIYNLGRVGPGLCFVAVGLLNI